MSWRPPYSNAGNAHDPHLDPYRDRVALLLDHGTVVARVLVVAKTFWDWTAGYLWWKQWSSPYEVVIVLVVFPDGGSDDWRIRPEDLDDFSRSRLHWRGREYDLQWLDPPASRGIRDDVWSAPRYALPELSSANAWNPFAQRPWWHSPAGKAAVSTSVGWLSIDEGTGTQTQRDVLHELTTMLAHLRPVGLDPSHSHLSWSATTDPLPQPAAVVTLEHRSRPEWSVELRIGASSADISWLSQREHVDEHDTGADRAWTGRAVDVLAAILRGRYVIEETTRLGRRCRTRVLNLTAPESLGSGFSGPSLRGTTSWWILLLWPFTATTTRTHVDFTRTA